MEESTKKALELTKKSKTLQRHDNTRNSRDFGKLATYDKKLKKDAEKLGIEVIP